MQKQVEFARHCWRHALTHSHEIVVALLVEVPKANLIMILLMVAGICIAFAVQVYFSVEE